MKVTKIYKVGGKSYVDLRHYQVLNCILKNDLAVIETPKGEMTLTPKQLANPVILSEKTIESKFGGRYCLFSYPLEIKSNGLSVENMAKMGIFG